MGEINSYKVLVIKTEGMRPFEYLDIHGRIMLVWISGK
jgi:hypothetical protein